MPDLPTPDPPAPALPLEDQVFWAAELRPTLKFRGGTLALTVTLPPGLSAEGREQLQVSAAMISRRQLRFTARSSQLRPLASWYHQGPPARAALGPEVPLTALTDPWTAVKATHLRQVLSELRELEHGAQGAQVLQWLRPAPAPQRPAPGPLGGATFELSAPLLPARVLRDAAQSAAAPLLGPAVDRAYVHDPQVAALELPSALPLEVWAAASGSALALRGLTRAARQLTRAAALLEQDARRGEPAVSAGVLRALALQAALDETGGRAAPRALL